MLNLFSLGAVRSIVGLPTRNPPNPEPANLGTLAALAIGVALITLRTPIVPSYGIALTLSAGGGGVLLFLARRRRLSSYGCVAVLVVLLCLCVSSRWQSQLLPGSCERQELQFEGIVHGLPTTQESFGEPAYSFLLKVRSIAPPACAGPGLVRLRVARQMLEDVSESGAELLPGDLLSGSLRLKRPWGFVNPKSERGERPYLVDGIHGLGSVTAVSQHGRGHEFQIMARVHQLRDSIASELLTRAGPDAGPLMAALSVGDRRQMTNEHWALLRTFGLTHLLVVSGLHVSFLALPGWYLGRLVAFVLQLFGCGRRVVRLLPYGFSLGLAGAYGMLAGLSLPTLRALLMLALVFVPGLCRRPLDRSRALGACALSLLIISPASVLGASFWLSMTAVSLLLWLSLWQAGSTASLLLKTQAYLVFAMVPISLFWFGVVSTLGVFANVLAVPLVTWFLLPSLLGGVLITRINIFYGKYLIDFSAYIIEKSLLFLNQIHAQAASFGEFRAQPPGVYLGVALIAGLCVGLPRFPYRRLMIGLLLAPALVAAPKPQGGVVVRILDVGQGTAILISRHVYNALYDTGRSTHQGQPRIAGALMPLALAKGMKNLDLLVISHEDDDHNGGEPFVIDSLPPRKILRGGPRESPDGACRPGQHVPLGANTWLQSLSVAVPGDSDNDGSCVLLLHAYGRRILLPGDIERGRERDLVAYWGADLRADVLLAAHHGSNTSTSQLFLRSVSPELVVITSGRANRFGHPTAEVLTAIERQGAQSLNTADGGAITLRISPQGDLFCTRQRHRFSPFWMRGHGRRNCGVMRGPSRV